MDDFHVVVVTTGDVVFWGLLALLTVVFVALVAGVAGYNAGIRAEHRARAEQYDADVDEAVAEFGPLRAGLISRPGDRASLRRIK